MLTIKADRVEYFDCQHVWQCCMKFVNFDLHSLQTLFAMKEILIHHREPSANPLTANSVMECDCESESKGEIEWK